MRPRQIEIDGPSQPALDPRSVVLGLPCQPAEAVRAEEPPTPVVVWQGSVRSQSSAGRSYFIVIYDNDTARCSCLDFHFRGTLKEDRGYACKHIRTARLQMSRWGAFSRPAQETAEGRLRDEALRTIADLMGSHDRG